MIYLTGFFSISCICKSITNHRAMIWRIRLLTTSVDAHNWRREINAKKTTSYSCSLSAVRFYRVNQTLVYNNIIDRFSSGKISRYLKCTYVVPFNLYCEVFPWDISGQNWFLSIILYRWCFYDGKMSNNTSLFYERKDHSSNLTNTYWMFI